MEKRRKIISITIVGELSVMIKSLQNLSALLNAYGETLLETDGFEIKDLVQRDDDDY